MTTEQREAIEDVEEFNNKFDCGKYRKSIDTVLSLLKQKDKQIDLMAEHIHRTGEYECPDIKCEDNEITCKDCIKQYFTNLVEKE